MPHIRVNDQRYVVNRYSDVDCRLVEHAPCARCGQDLSLTWVFHVDPDRIECGETDGACKMPYLLYEDDDFAGWSTPEITAIAIAVRSHFPEMSHYSPPNPNTIADVRNILCGVHTPPGSDPDYQMAVLEEAAKILAGKTSQVQETKRHHHRYSTGASPSLPWWRYHGFQSEDEERRLLGLDEDE